MSRRGEESITAFHHAVLESDCQELDPWLRIRFQCPRSGGHHYFCMLLFRVASLVSKSIISR